MCLLIFYCTSVTKINLSNSVHFVMKTEKKTIIDWNHLKSTAAINTYSTKKTKIIIDKIINICLCMFNPCFRYSENSPNTNFYTENSLNAFNYTSLLFRNGEFNLFTSFFSAKAVEIWNV